MNTTDLANAKCLPCEDPTMRPLPPSRVQELLPQIPGWEYDQEKNALHRRYPFGNFADGLAFVNRVGEIAEREGHHPDLLLTFPAVDVTLFTHAMHGLSDNDFILAAKINALEGQSE